MAKKNNNQVSAVRQAKHGWISLNVPRRGILIL